MQAVIVLIGIVGAAGAAETGSWALAIAFTALAGIGALIGGVHE